MTESSICSSSDTAPVGRFSLRCFVATFRDRPWLTVAVAYFFLSAPFMGFYPIPSGDEVIGVDPGAEWVLHGNIRSSLFGELPGFDRGYFLQPPGQFLSAAATYALLGQSMVTTRLQELVWGAVALAAWGSLAAGWTRSRRAGLLTALLVACIPMFGQTVAEARMDPQALALVALAIRLWLPAPGVVSRHPLVAGVLLGLAGLTHPAIIFYAIGLGIGALLSSGERKSALVWLIAGAVIPFAGWMIWAANNWSEFTLQFLRHGGGKIGGLNLASLAIREIARTGESFILQPLLPLLYVGGAWSWWRRFAADRDFRRETSALGLAVVFGITFVLEKGSGPHNLYYCALLSVGAAAMLDTVLQNQSARSVWPRWLATGAIFVVLLTGGLRWAVPRAVSIGPQRAARDHAAFAREISRLVPPGSNVAGEPVAYYAVRAAGGWLRLGVPPDPRRHHFVISFAKSPWQLSSDFETIAVVGQPLPPWHGRTFSPNDELYVVVARSRLLSPQ